MYQFKPEDLTEKNRYKFMIGTIAPRPIALVTSKSQDDVLNIAPFSYFNIVTHNPMIVSISVGRKDGEQKDTSRNILESKEAIIHIMDMDNVEDANQTADPLKAEESELELTNFTLKDVGQSKIPGLNESKVVFETELYQHVPIEKDGIVTADLLLLRINSMEIDESVYDKDKGYVDLETLRPIARMAGDDYMKMGEQFTIERPR